MYVVLAVPNSEDSSPLLSVRRATLLRSDVDERTGRSRLKIASRLADKADARSVARNGAGDGVWLVVMEDDRTVPDGRARVYPDGAYGGRRYHRDTRRYRDSQLHRSTGQGDRRRSHGAAAHRGHVPATVLRRAERVRRYRDGTRSLWFQAGKARSNGDGRRQQFLLHGSPRRRRRHVQDHPGHGQATSGRMLGTPAPVTQRVPARAHALPPLSGASADGWHSLATFANIPSGSTANLEGEPSALVYR